MCSSYVSTVLDLYFDFLDINLVYFDCVPPLFNHVLTLGFSWLSRPKLGIFVCDRPLFRLCSTHILNILDLCFGFLD